MRARPVALSLAAVAFAAACRGIIAPPPPTGAPDTLVEARVPGDRRVVAPRAARRLSDAGFTTKRFGSDSLWGWRGQEKIAARLRYANGSGDTARVLLELWGPCPAGVRRPCLQREAAAILASLNTEDPVPQ